MHADTRKVGDLLDHPLCHVGASDAGAHVAQFCGAGDTTFLLEKYVRDEDRLSLERAVHRITGELADDWGIGDRGRIAPGLAADLVLFDPDEVARGDEQFVEDVPGTARRYVRPSSGVDTVLVNGEVTWRRGEYTQARAGRVV